MVTNNQQQLINILTNLKNSLFSDAVIIKMIYETKIKIWKLCEWVISAKKSVIFLSSKIEKLFWSKNSYSAQIIPFFFQQRAVWLMSLNSFQTLGTEHETYLSMNLKTTSSSTHNFLMHFQHEWMPKNVVFFFLLSS